VAPPNEHYCAEKPHCVLTADADETKQFRRVGVGGVYGHNTDIVNQSINQSIKKNLKTRHM